MSPDRKRAITYGTAATGVLRCGCRRAHLTRAAERLRIAEPAVSQQIRRWRPSLASGCCTATGARSPSRQLARRCCPMRALPSRRSSTAGKPWPRCAGWSPASSAALTTPTAVGRATWMGVGSRSGRYLDRDRVRVSAPGARRRGPRRARDAPAGAVPRQYLAPPDRRRGLQARAVTEQTTEDREPSELFTALRPYGTPIWLQRHSSQGGECLTSGWQSGRA